VPKICERQQGRVAGHFAKRDGDDINESNSELI